MINSGYVEFPSKRPNNFNQLDAGPANYSVEIGEFFKDLTEIYFVLNSQEPLTIKSIFDAAGHMCKLHIKTNGRLIDVDLYLIIDIILISKNNIWLKFFNDDTMSGSEAAFLWIELKNFLVKRFEESIFITRYTMSNSRLDLI